MNLNGSFISISADGFPILDSDLERTKSRDRSDSDAPKSRKHRESGGETPGSKKSKAKSKKRSSGTKSGSPSKNERPLLTTNISKRTLDSSGSLAMLQSTQSRSESINTSATHKTDKTQRVSNLRKKQCDSSDPLLELPDEDLVDIDISARTKSTRSSAQSGAPSQAALTASERQLINDSRFVRKRSYQPLLGSANEPGSIFSLDSEEVTLPVRPLPTVGERPKMNNSNKPKSRSRKISKQKSEAKRRNSGAEATTGGPSRELGTTFPVEEVIATKEPVQGLPSRTKKPMWYDGVPNPQANDETASTGVSGESAGSSRSTKLLMKMLKAQQGLAFGISSSNSKASAVSPENLAQPESRPQMTSNQTTAPDSRRSSLVTMRSKQGVREDLGAFGSLSKTRINLERQSSGGLKPAPGQATLAGDQQEKASYHRDFSPETPSPSALMPASLKTSGGKTTKKNSAHDSLSSSFQTSITSMETDVPSSEEACSKASSMGSRKMLDEGSTLEGTSGFKTPPELDLGMSAEISSLRPPETPQGAYGSDRSLADSIDTEDLKGVVKVPGLLDVSGGSNLQGRRELDVTRERSNRSHGPALDEQKPSPSEQTFEWSNQSRKRIQEVDIETGVDPNRGVGEERDRDPKLSMRGISIESSQRSRNQQSSKESDLDAVMSPLGTGPGASPSRLRSLKSKKRSSRRQQRQHESPFAEAAAGASGPISPFGDSPQTPRSNENIPQHQTPDTAPLSATPRSTYPSDLEASASTFEHSNNGLGSASRSRNRPSLYSTAGAYAMDSEDSKSYEYAKSAALSLDAPVFVGAMSMSTPATIADSKKHRDSLSSHGIQAAQPVVAGAAYRVRHTKLQEEEVEYPKTHSKDHSTDSGDFEDPLNMVIHQADPWGFHTMGKRKVYTIYGVLALVLVALIAAVAVLAANQGRDETNVTTTPTGGPAIGTSSTPTVSPTEGGPTLTSSEIEDLLLQWTDQSSLDSEGLPQADARVWLMSASNQDYLTMPNRLLQRFALASFFYSTNGVNWENRSGWLSSGNECEWFSTAMDPHEVCDRENFVTSLDLQLNGLLGAIPSELAVLTRLSHLDLSGNHLYDFLPPLSLATSLKTLIVDDNDISNFLHDDLGKFTNLETISLNGNRLAGPLPTSLMNLTSLRVLSIASNFLGGTLHTEIGNLSALQLFDIESNDFTGQIPSQLSRVTSLIDLSLAHNGFAGTLPTELSRLTLLETLDLSYNSITSAIISEIGFMTNLKTVWLFENSFFGTIPLELGLLKDLKWLDISVNALQGSIPRQLTLLTGLERLHAAQNAITGKLPDAYPDKMALSTVDLRDNLLSGSIPSQAGSISVEFLDLSLNEELAGTIPTDVMESARYRAVIDLTGTSLGGKVFCLDEFTNKDGILRVDCGAVQCQGQCCQCGSEDGVLFL